MTIPDFRLCWRGRYQSHPGDYPPSCDAYIEILHTGSYSVTWKWWIDKEKYGYACTPWRRKFFGTWASAVGWTPPPPKDF